jgi:hypothetical protein
MQTKPKPCEGTRRATELLVERERFVGAVYVPTIEDQGIQAVIIGNGGSTFNTSSDFLTYECRYPNVIGILPAGLGDAYARRALDIVFHKVALLLPVRFMETPRAKKLFAETPLVRVYVVTEKIPYRRGTQAWFVWEKGNWTSPKIRWI